MRCISDFPSICSSPCTNNWTLKTDWIRIRITTESVYSSTDTLMPISFSPTLKRCRSLFWEGHGILSEKNKNKQSWTIFHTKREPKITSLTTEKWPVDQFVCQTNKCKVVQSADLLLVSFYLLAGFANGIHATNVHVHEVQQTCSILS